MNAINGESQLLGLIGTDIRYSKSFVLHNFCIEQQQRNAIYVPFCASSTSLHSLFRLQNFVGANVTLPYKEALLETIDHLSTAAEKIGAINTILHKDGSVYGDNTDAEGFLNAVKHLQIQWSEHPIFLLGAGGAAKAICYALQTQGVTEISVWNRTRTRIQSLESLIPNIQHWDLHSLPENAIVLNCTPLGKHNEHPLHPLQFTPYHTVIDLLYQETPLLQAARKKGSVAINGLGMLIHQAALSYAQWFDCSPPVSMMTHAIQSTSTEYYP